jgi:hypothetical protein
LVVGSLLNDVQICRDVSVSDTVMKSCGPMSLAELAPLAIVIGLLLAPELSELSIAGVLSLTRRVDETERQLGTFEAYA